MRKEINELIENAKKDKEEDINLNFNKYSFPLNTIYSNEMIENTVITKEEKELLKKHVMRIDTFFSNKTRWIYSISFFVFYYTFLLVGVKEQYYLIFQPSTFLISLFWGVLFFIVFTFFLAILVLGFIENKKRSFIKKILNKVENQKQLITIKYKIIKWLEKDEQRAAQALKNQLIKETVLDIEKKKVSFDMSIFMVNDFITDLYKRHNKTKTPLNKKITAKEQDKENEQQYIQKITQFIESK